MLTLFITLNTPTVSAGEMPELTARLINEGDDILLVNSRMLLVPAAMPDDRKEMVIHIDGPPDSMNLMRVHVQAKPPLPGDFVRLFPGEYLYSVYTLEEHFSYEEPGTYRVFAEYFNQIDLVVDGIRSWKGHIRSNNASFGINV